MPQENRHPISALTPRDLGNSSSIIEVAPSLDCGRTNTLPLLPLCISETVSRSPRTTSDNPLLSILSEPEAGCSWDPLNVFRLFSSRQLRSPLLNNLLTRLCFFYCSHLQLRVAPRHSRHRPSNRLAPPYAGLLLDLSVKHVYVRFLHT